MKIGVLAVLLQGLSFQIPSPTAKIPDFVPRLAVEVLNAHQIEHRIVHFEDLVGPSSKTIGTLQPAKAVLVMATSLKCDACGDHWATLARADKLARKGGGQVVALLWGKPEAKEKVRKALRKENYEFIVAWDGHRIAQLRLGLMRRGSALIIRSDGSVNAKFVRGGGPVEALLKSFEQAMKQGG